MKNFKKIGIYTIFCTISNKHYIGYSNNIEKRFKEHKYNLNLNIHCNDHIQAAWNKYKENNFIFKILEECIIENLPIREHYWATLLKTHDRKFGYNIQPTNEEGIFKTSEETRKKISLSNTGKKASKAAKEKMSKARMGNKFALGLIHTEYTKSIISFKNKGIIKDQKWRDKIGLAHKNKIVSEETKNKLKEIRKNNPKKSLKIAQYDKDDKFIKEWSCRKEVSTFFNQTLGGITQAIKKNKLYKEHYWKYIDTYKSKSNYEKNNTVNI